MLCIYISIYTLSPANASGLLPLDDEDDDIAPDVLRGALCEMLYIARADFNFVSELR